MTDPRIRERRKAVARAAGRRRLRLLLVAIGAVAVAVGTLFALHSSLFSARHITILGNARLPRKEVIRTSGLNGDPPLIDINPARVAAKLEKLPTVATVQVSLRWPDSVNIVLTGRAAAVAIPITPTRYAVIDAASRVLFFVEHAPAGLPVVLGSSFVGHAGTYLVPSGRALVDVARSLGRGLGADVREVGYDSSGQIALELKSGPVAIFGDASELTQKLVSLATVLHDVNLTHIATIDLSAPSSPVLTPIGAGRSVVLVAGG